MESGKITYDSRLTLMKIISRILQRLKGFALEGRNLNKLTQFD